MYICMYVCMYHYIIIIDMVNRHGIWIPSLDMVQYFNFRLLDYRLLPA